MRLTPLSHPGLQISTRRAGSGYGSWMERLDELVQFRVVEIGDGPEGHAVARPVPHVEAAKRARVGRGLTTVRSGPYEDIDRVLPALIDERGDGAAGKVIESAADQRKAERREGDDGR